MNKHSRLGGSTSARWLTCTASPNAIQKAIKDGIIPKEQPSSIYAEEGTAAHTLLEKAIRRKVDAEAFFMKSIGGFTVDENMISAVQVHIDRVKSLTNNYDKRFTVWLEKRFDLSDYVGDDCGGSADITIYDTKEAHLWVDDYKHGKGKMVEAEGNTQTRLYGLGFLKELQQRIETVDLTICQPRISHIDGPIRTENLKRRELLKWGRTVLKPAVKEINSDSAKFVPSEKACEWCPLNGVACPASDNHSVALMKAEFQDFVEQKSLVNPSSLTKEEAEAIVLNKKKITSWLNNVELHLKNAIESGEKSSNFKLVQSLGNRSYIKQRSVIRKLKKLGVPEEVYLSEPALKTPSQLESSMVAHKQMTKDEIKEFISAVTTRVENGYRIAPINSGKEAIQSTAQSDFSEVVE